MDCTQFMSEIFIFSNVKVPVIFQFICQKLIVLEFPSRFG